MAALAQLDDMSLSQLDGALLFLCLSVGTEKRSIRMFGLMALSR